MNARKKVSVLSFILVVAMMLMVMPTSVLASDQYSNNGTTYSALPSPGSYGYFWEYSSSGAKSTSTSYDGNEEVHVTLTANLAGEVTYEGTKFNVGFQGTAECTFVRSRYDSWANYRKYYKEAFYETDWTKTLAMYALTGQWYLYSNKVYTGNTAYQDVTHEWNGHLYGSWYLSSAYKR